MIDKNTFDIIFVKAKEYKYSSTNYTDFDDCKSAEILYDWAT